MSDSSSESQQQWDKQTIQDVLLAHVREQRLSRRWSIFFKLVTLGLVCYLILNLFKLDINTAPAILKQDHTAVIDIRGVIDSEQNASADNINSALDMAAENKHVKGIILRINSPGGSPVQARQIYDKVQALQTGKLEGKHDRKENVKIYALIEDLGTSAAYLIASAAEEIHADKTSLVGSIGVIMDGFGFTDTMNKVGVERRLYVAGHNKALLDPFSPRNHEQEKFIEGELQTVHQAFIQNVRDGRKDRLKETPDMFSGLLWSGEHALNLGLIDGHKNAQMIAKELIKADSLVDYTPGMNVLDRLVHRIGASIGNVNLNLQSGNAPSLK